MSINPTYPGVYVQELPSGVRTIVGVGTSITAFVDRFKRGPLNKATRVLSWGDFQRKFGGLDAKSEASYAVQQFFLNGGTEAFVVRVATSDAVKADVTIGGWSTTPDPDVFVNSLKVSAHNIGSWANNVRVKVDYTGCAAGEFNLTISEYETSNGRTVLVDREVFRNLSMTSGTSNFVETVVNDTTSGSQLVTVSGLSTTRPAANGLLSGSHGNVQTITLAGAGGASPTVNMQVNNGSEIPLKLPAGAQTLTAVASALQQAIRAVAPSNPLYAGATVSVVGTSDNRFLHVVAGGGSASTRIVFTVEGGDSTATDVKLTDGAGAVSAVQEHELGTNQVENTSHMAGNSGADGDMPGAVEIIGVELNKEGLYALANVDLFNILCIPRAGILAGGTTDPDNEPSQADSIMSAAVAYCEARRAIFLMDPPKGTDTVEEIEAWLQTKGSLRSANAALYFPRVKVPDPLNDYRLRAVGPCGSVAGVIARTDGTRGVWKAPAGTEAVLRNVSALEYQLTDGENGVLSPLAVNCLRTFPVHGTVAWGARTLKGADQQASEWKYLPVRRLALYIEESLYRGTQWVVFEPNDEPLWSQIRLNLGAFMHTLFRQGAFQGKSPQEAYFVKCDRETTTQDDINRGIVNIVVGFAPLKPAEFVIIKLQQIAGQVEA